MNRFEIIAKNLVSDDDQLVDIARGLERLRGRYKPTSDEALVIAILRDMVVHFRHGNLGVIPRLADELEGMLKVKEWGKKEQARKTAKIYPDVINDKRVNIEFFKDIEEFVFAHVDDDINTDEGRKTEREVKEEAKRLARKYRHTEWYDGVDEATVEHYIWEEIQNR